MSKLFRREFLTFSPHKQAAIVAALRGPDVEELVGLKYHITARLRAIACVGWPGGFYDATSATDETLLAIGGAIKHQQVGCYHYLMHLAHAVFLTKTHPVWGGHGALIYHRLVELTEGAWLERKI